MKTVSKTFTRDGFTFRQIRRAGDLALYRKHKVGAGGNIQSFEVIRIQKATQPATLPSGATVQAGDELYPASSKWGKAGWTYQTEEQAQKAFEDRLEEIKFGASYAESRVSEAPAG